MFGSPRPTSRGRVTERICCSDEDAQYLFPPPEGVHLSSLSLESLVSFSAILTPESVSANQANLTFGLSKVLERWLFIDKLFFFQAL